MDWRQVDKNWWRGSEGAWVRFTYQDISPPGQLPEYVPKYVAWRDGQPIKYWFNTLKEAQESL